MVLVFGLKYLAVKNNCAGSHPGKKNYSCEGFVAHRCVSLQLATKIDSFCFKISELYPHVVAHCLESNAKETGSAGSHPKERKLSKATVSCIAYCIGALCRAICTT